MIGMVLVTHGGLATEFRAALEHVVGPQQQLATITIGPEDDMEQRRSDILAAVRSVDSGEGVVLLTDMFGGTPSNLAMQIAGTDRPVEVLAGVNLPLLVKLAKVRGSEPLAEAVDHAKAAGRKYIASGREVAAGAQVTPVVPARRNGA